MQSSRDRLWASIQALKRKDLLPDHTKDYFSIENLDMMVHSLKHQKFKNWTCPTCQITVYGNNKMLIEHHKIHSQRREMGENEIYQRSYHID